MPFDSTQHHAVFIAPKLEQIFRNKGYCAFPLLSSGEADEVVGIYEDFEKHHGADGNKFHGTGWIQDTELRVIISNSVTPIIVSALNRVFKNYKILGSSFLQKESGEDTGVLLHQDWTYVDENQFYSMNIWIALEDVSIDNGAMFIIPYSHRIFSGYLRPAPDYPVPFRNLIGKLEPYKQTIELRKGECICFNNALLHGSHPNLLNSKRLVVVTTLLPENADLVHHYVQDTKQPEKIIEYTLDAVSFLKIKRGQHPENFISKKPVASLYKPRRYAGFIANYIFYSLRNWFFSRNF